MKQRQARGAWAVSKLQCKSDRVTFLPCVCMLPPRLYLLATNVGVKRHKHQLTPFRRCLHVKNMSIAREIPCHKPDSIRSRLRRFHLFTESASKLAGLRLRRLWDLLASRSNFSCAHMHLHVHVHRHIKMYLHMHMHVHVSISMFM